MGKKSISSVSIEKFISGISPLIIDTVGVEKSLRAWLIEMGVEISDIKTLRATIGENLKNNPDYFEEFPSLIDMIKAKRQADGS
jgi:hypothetical protein